MSFKRKTSITFEKFQNQIKIPFVIYAHFDSLRIHQKSKIIHKPSGFGYSIKCRYDDSLSKYEEYVGEDSPQVFWEKMEEEAEELAKHLNTKKSPKVLSDKEREDFSNSESCYFCNSKFTSKKQKIEDFCELTGEFLGAAHENCAKVNKVTNVIPVIFNNFSKYGLHFLLKDLNGQEMEDIFIVGENQGFAKKFPPLNFHFIDFKQFIDEKLENLEKILADTKKKRLKKEFKKEFNLMKQKISFPYFYMKGFEKFQSKQLPAQDGFHDQLHDQDISSEDYQRCVDVWKKFKCKTMRDYFGMYLKSNVYLLEDIFENFRLLCLSKYGLDPSYYYTIAGFSWDSMLKFTGVTLELLKDSKIIDFFKSNIRGGMVQCSKRHAKANNIYCDFDEEKPSTFIVYLDANNLGGWAMSQKLPFSDFSWLNEAEIQYLSPMIPKLEENGDFGYIFEVDLDYPKKLHKRHSDLPFCPEYVPLPSTFGRKKQSLNFYPKKNYVIDYRTLKQCLENGLVLKKVHRALKFKQENWLEPYITYNTTLRAKAKNEFETNLYKLLNNSVYGKTIQKTTSDKPIYAGFSILELSKKFMYDFHYTYMVPKYKDKLNLLYIDTDGVIYEIETDDFYKDLKSDSKLLKMMDTSNLVGRWGIPSKNKKTVGKMKEEYGGKIIREFFGVGAKFYFLDVEGEEVKKAAGVKKYVKNKFIGRDDFERCVLKEKEVKMSSMETSADDHEVVSKVIKKTVLSPGDTKREILCDMVNTRAWGYQE